MIKDKRIFDGGFGLERETLRITENGRLAQTSHPFTESSLERDFCENQLEIITPVCKSTDEALEKLGELSDYAEQRLEEQGEYLWLYSNPPRIENEDEIPIARFDGEKMHKSEYRVNLERRYGKRLMLYSGIHFNFSFSDEFLKSQCDTDNFAEFKNSTYLRVFKYASRYSWLIVMLTSASPVCDLSFEKDNAIGTEFDGFASRRNGEKGYWNGFIPRLDYSSLKAYTESVGGYIEKGALFSAGELYLPVRIKPRGENSLQNLAENGADHIELRMFDLNPLAPQGIFAEDLRFAHYFLVYLMSLPDFEFTPKMQKHAVENHKSASDFDLSVTEINGYPAVTVAMGLLDDMSFYFSKFPEVLEIIDIQREKLIGERRYADIIFQSYGNAFHEKMLSKTLERSRKKKNV